MLTLRQDGWTALHAACQEGHAQVAEMLLQAGASVEQETEVRWSVGQDCVCDTVHFTWSQSVERIAYSSIDLSIALV